MTGRKRFAPDGAAADYLILSARTSGAEDDKKGITLFLVPADAKGVKAEPLSMADSRHLADIQLEGVEVGSASLLGSVDGGGDLLSNILDVGRIALAAEMLGGAREVFDRTLAHLKERKQFDPNHRLLSGAQTSRREAVLRNRDGALHRAGRAGRA